MQDRIVQLNAEFRTQAIKAILAIVFFILTYFALLGLTAWLTVWCIWLGIKILSFHTSGITILIGLGLASFGFLILVFLIKFMFTSTKVDRTGLLEIHASEHPELFKMIDELVRTVGTTFPKKVYLSNEVNASVTYDSSFWSMFLPIQKNLHIGVGLINTLTREELRSVLAHEFGHFSQRTMKVGSYVYNVNRVIFNMLFENSNYASFLHTWASINSLLQVFALIAGKLIHGIQWILKMQYVIVNKSYLALSREMEFHADEIAASVTGFESLRDALLRIPLAGNTFQNVLSIYEKKIGDNIVAKNIYADQLRVLNLVTQKNQYPLTNGLPLISINHFNKYNKSKLVIKDQWASHPSLEQRIARLEATGYSAVTPSTELANSLLNDFTDLQESMTQQMFEPVAYTETPLAWTSEELLEHYQKEVEKNAMPELFNEYYDDHDPLYLPENTGIRPGLELKLETLFSDEKVNFIYTFLSLRGDIIMLHQLFEESSVIKSFDYDGVKYKKQSAMTLAERLQRELDIMQKQVLEHEANVYTYFSELEKQQHKAQELENHYRIFYQFNEYAQRVLDPYSRLTYGLQFISVETPLEDITLNFRKLFPLEKQLKEAIQELITDKQFEAELTTEVKENFYQYTSQHLRYFDGASYEEDHLKILYTALNDFNNLISNRHSALKKELLKYMETLTKEV